MTGFIEDQVLRFEGLTDEDIANINAILPELEELFRILQQEWPTIAKIIPVLVTGAQKVIAKQKELK